MPKQCLVTAGVIFCANLQTFLNSYFQEQKEYVYCHSLSFIIYLLILFIHLQNWQTKYMWKHIRSSFLTKIANGFEPRYLFRL